MIFSLNPYKVCGQFFGKFIVLQCCLIFSVYLDGDLSMFWNEVLFEDGESMDKTRESAVLGSQASWGANKKNSSAIINVVIIHQQFGLCKPHHQSVTHIQPTTGSATPITGLPGPNRPSLGHNLVIYIPSLCCIIRNGHYLVSSGLFRSY